jgi:hypothetical protein
MKKYAITEMVTDEFYPDPIYFDKEKARAKVNYLRKYEVEHNMKGCDWYIEELTPEREAQHEKEWIKFVGAID